MEKQKEEIDRFSTTASIIGWVAVRAVPCYLVCLAARGFYLYHWEGVAAWGTLLFPRFWWAAFAITTMGSHLYRKQRLAHAGTYGLTEPVWLTTLKALGNAAYEISGAAFLTLWAIGLFG